MKIEEIESGVRNCNTFIDWIKFEKRIKVLDFCMPYFIQLGGRIDEEKKQVVMFFNFRNNTFQFLINNCYMDFMIDKILIGRMRFLQEYIYKKVSTRDIYDFINLIAYSVQKSFENNEDYDYKIENALAFPNVMKKKHCVNLEELDEVLNYGGVKLDFLIYSFNERTPFYRIRKNVNHNNVSRIQECLAPPSDCVTNQERFNQKHESMLYGSLFFANPCFQEANLELNETYILVKGILEKKLEFAAFINPCLEYFLKNNKKDFITNILNIFKMNIIEDIVQRTKCQQENIYDLTNHLKKYASKSRKWDGYLYYSTKNKVNYNVALTSNKKVKVEKVYECFTLNDLDEYNQFISYTYEADLDHNGYSLRWKESNKNKLDYLTNFPSTDYLFNAQYYLNKELRNIEISNGDPLEYDINGRKWPK